MKPQTITLQTDDGQTLTLTVTSAIIGEPEQETPAEVTGEPVEEAAPMSGTPVDRLKKRRAEQMMA